MAEVIAPTIKTCAFCDKRIARTRVTCGSDPCREAATRLHWERRRARRALRPRPTPRLVLSRSQRLAIHEECGWICYLCEDAIDPTEEYPSLWSAVVDHVVPLGLGGSNERSNLASTHSYCNAVKKDKTLEQMGFR